MPIRPPTLTPRTKSRSYPTSHFHDSQNQASLRNTHKARNHRTQLQAINALFQSNSKPVRFVHLSRPKLLTDPSFKSIYARKILPTAPSNPNPTSLPTPSTYSPKQSPRLPSTYPRSPAEPDYHILPDDLSSQNTALSLASQSLGREGIMRTYGSFILSVSILSYSFVAG